jgi:hypothetical protein
LLSVIWRGFLADWSLDESLELIAMSTSVTFCRVFLHQMTF